MYQKHPNTNNIFIEYGTAGFRTKANLLDHILYRMGILASIRSMHQKASIGVMITASHNPEDDNGVKLVDPKGEMLNHEWEKYATELANVSNNKLEEYIANLLIILNISNDVPSSVIFGRDTRSSSLSLSEFLKDGLKAIKSTFIDLGVVTTPQLHYVVCCTNDNSYGIPTVDGYYNKLSKAFNNLNSEKNELINYKPSVIIDGANGVGAFKIKNMSLLISNHLNIVIHNDSSNGILNHKCGADYVKLYQKPSEGMPISDDIRYASFDGDADRIVFFYVDKDKMFHLLDGDKISTLIGCYLNELILKSSIDIKIGVIQTAYANGASTTFLIQNMNVPVKCVPTGVKHLHLAAHSFDVGIYFEANGHGTILFSQMFKQLVNETIENKSCKFNENQQISAKKLFNFMNLTKKKKVPTATLR